MKSWSLLLFALLLTTLSTSFAQPRNTRPQIRNSDRSEQDLRAHERGYRTGYEDGFENGKDDFNRDQPRDFTRSQDYQHADRAYERQMGRAEEYQDGYRIGFELGYNDGYFGRPFSLSVPQNLTTVVVGAGTVAKREQPEDKEPVRDDRRSTPRDSRPDIRPNDRGNERPIDRTRTDAIVIPEGDQMRIRLTSPLSTKTNREGDQFTASVVSPSAYVNATIVGHIARITHSGKATGKTEMLLAFDEITMPDGRSSPFEAQVEKVYDGATVKTVDEEGNVQTGSRTKDTATRGAGGAALGAIIGGIAGGGKGAAIGAVLGGAAGAGSVYVQSGKDIIFETGTEMMIRSLGKQR